MAWFFDLNFLLWKAVGYHDGRTFYYTRQSAASLWVCTNDPPLWLSDLAADIHRKT